MWATRHPLVHGFVNRFGYNAAHMKRWGKIATACVVVLLLAMFGINNIGGDTWISASAPLPDGFQRGPHGPVHQRETARLVPIILVVTLAAGALLHGYVRRPVEDNASAEEDEAKVTTAPNRTIRHTDD